MLCPLCRARASLPQGSPPPLLFCFSAHTAIHCLHTHTHTHTHITHITHITLHQQTCTHAQLTCDYHRHLGAHQCGCSGAVGCSLLAGCRTANRANEIRMEANRKTLTANDVLDGLKDMDFEEFVQPLTANLEGR